MQSLLDMYTTFYSSWETPLKKRCEISFLVHGQLTLINAAFFYYYLTRGGAQSSAPSNRPKNRGLGVKHGRTLKYRQL